MKTINISKLNNKIKTRKAVAWGFRKPGKISG